MGVTQKDLKDLWAMANYSFYNEGTSYLPSKQVNGC